MTARAAAARIMQQYHVKLFDLTIVTQNGPQIQSSRDESIFTKLASQRTSPGAQPEQSNGLWATIVLVEYISPDDRSWPRYCSAECSNISQGWDFHLPYPFDVSEYGPSRC